MADYQCYPLWNVEEVGNIDPNKLPISTVLKKHLNSWAECYDETLVIDDPKLSGFKNDKEALAFEEQGRFLWQQLQKELGNQYEIFYFSHLTSQLKKLGNWFFPLIQKHYQQMSILKCQPYEW